MLPAYLTEIMQVPFQRALIVARECAISEPIYSTAPTEQTFGVAVVKVAGVVPVMDSLNGKPVKSVTTTLSADPLTVTGDSHVLLRRTTGRFQTIVLIVDAGAQRSSPACDAVMLQVLVSPARPGADVTK